MQDERRVSAEGKKWTAIQAVITGSLGTAALMFIIALLISRATSH